MEVQAFLEVLCAQGIDFFVGVPDSQLRPLCDTLMRRYGMGKKHVIAANEGNCAAIAAGYYLATGRVPAVYLQNSGLGNIANPAISLLHPQVYGIPCVYIVGWRGEPGKPDEPQHQYQGKVTLPFLEVLGVPAFALSSDTTEQALREAADSFGLHLSRGQSVAYVVRKGGLVDSSDPVAYANPFEMSREETIQRVLSVSGSDPVLCTTGKASRELFELREKNGMDHDHDFLTVGSMGHCSSIALGIALHAPEKKIWCLDGDGAALMHMGAMAVIGARRPENLVHILLNNAAHESVGGMPTVSETVDWPMLAKSCGYPEATCANTYEALDEALQKARKEDQLCFLEARVSLGARADLGRPTASPKENKEAFMREIGK